MLMLLSIHVIEIGRHVHLLRWSLPDCDNNNSLALRWINFPFSSDATDGPVCGDFYPSKVNLLAVFVVFFVRNFLHWFLISVNREESRRVLLLGFPGFLSMLLIRLLFAVFLPGSPHCVVRTRKSHRQSNWDVALLVTALGYLSSIFFIFALFFS